MALKIRTTGMEQYAPGGTANLRVFILGHGGRGKSRWSSYTPKPIFAACEPGIAAIADRQVPYGEINTSQDMLDLLQFLKMECRQPPEQRKYRTLVIDTLDSYAKRLKEEWREANRKETFTGRDAWSWLDQKLNMLMLRVLNLDMHTVVLCHLKDKVTKDDESGRETHEMMARLQGQFADSVYDDFDFVGHMESEWAAVDGKRVEVRHLTFHKSPVMPMLKDRMGITPERIPVKFQPGDWEALFTRLQGRIDELKPSQDVEEIPSFQPTPAAAVVTPDLAPAGPLPPQPAAQINLGQLDKPAIVEMIKARGIKHLPDGAPIKQNTLKSELVKALEHHRRATPTTAAGSIQPMPSPYPDTKPELPAGHVADAVGIVNEGTGEIVQPFDPEVIEDRAIAAAVETIANTLGGVPAVLDPTVTAPQPEQAEAPSTDPDPTVCDTCGKDISPTSEENPSYVRLAWIRHRRRLCGADFLAYKP